MAGRLGFAIMPQKRIGILKKLRYLVFLASLVAILFIPATRGETADDGTIAYTRAGKMYHQLIKEKPKFRDKWLAASKEFEKIYNDKNASPDISAKALFSSANLYFELHKLSYASIDLKESKRLYSLLVRQYSQHRLADNSLYRVGEISLKEGDKKGAYEAFKLLQEKYPKGNMSSEASKRLKEISYVPSPSPSPAPLPTPAPKPTPPVVAPPTTVTHTETKRAVNKKYEKRLVIIDAGHGGKDSGAVGVNRILEKRVVLDIALKLKTLLEKDGGYKVVMTRTRDNFISLQNRTKIANKNGSAIFVSIHANASKNKKLHGIETFFQGLPKSEAAKETAARENMVFIDKKLPSKDNMLLFILSDMKNAYLINESSHLAETIQANLIKGMSKKYSRIKNLGVKQALFFVLNDAQIPSVLVEVSFLTHHEEGKRLADSGYRTDIARSIYEGIDRYTSEIEKVATRE
ncbi:MAG: N-acetylmuramoyl-L-alanine amidase [Nitrospinota bacterium]